MFFFFFQAEDGIRDLTVTGVQTCALPILMWLAVLMAINSVIGAYYYLRVIVVMYMRESSAEAKSAAPVGFPLTVNFVLAFTVAGTLYFGLFPNQVLNFILQPTLLGH